MVPVAAKITIRSNHKGRPVAGSHLSMQALQSLFAKLFDDVGARDQPQFGVERDELLPKGVDALRILNVDGSDEGMLRFLVGLGFEPLIDQYEMVRPV